MKEKEGQIRTFREPTGADVSRENAAVPRRTRSASSDASLIVERAQQELAASKLDGITGVAYGRTANGENAIVVYVRDAATATHIPKTIVGLQVQTIVTGSIDAYDARP
jgi:hypothetical protein